VLVPQFVRHSAAVGAGSLADWSTSLVMKGSPVRVRASALGRVAGKNAWPDVSASEPFWNTSLQMRVPTLPDGETSISRVLIGSGLGETSEGS
jgi:hypothetical protein